MIVILFVLSLVFAFAEHPIFSLVADKLIPFTLGLWMLVGKFFSKKFGQKFRKWEIILGVILLVSPLITFIGQF